MGVSTVRPILQRQMENMHIAEGSHAGEYLPKKKILWELSSRKLGLASQEVIPLGVPGIITEPSHPTLFSPGSGESWNPKAGAFHP